ncbi:hypothetical protein K431DRAFT_282125 [Polychaeton citri CBS 116435]|uniref:Guanylate-binding protein N-terminal domain-containing protein n=1 Tax=Polychaeton citri CBS 116435 TaxID=1314669 RepID=A0A9P4QG45_9PEZI|nr:hypothetical protein K431DRAFT_282125 [Polychaeton citri CBS 116435]
MSSGGLSVRALTADEMPPSSMQWIQMIAPPAGNASPGKIENAALRVVENTNNAVRRVKQPLNLISVLGPARSGKSTLMNLLAGCNTELFATSNGAITYTKGIFVTTRILDLPTFSSLNGDPKIDPVDPNLQVSFLDTEGQGALGNLYDMNLFSPALLCSRVIIYNRTGGLLTAEILSQLGMMTQAGQRLKSGQVKEGATHGTSGSDPDGFTDGNAGGSTNGFTDGHISTNGSHTPASEAALGSNGTPNGTSHAATNGTTNGASVNGESKSKPQFGHLIILFNQFQLNATIETLRSGLLDPETGNDREVLERNQIRKLLQSSFESITIYKLPEGLKDEVRDEIDGGNKNRFLTINDFRTRYLEAFKTLRKGIASSLTTPQCLIPDVPLTGGAMGDFMLTFAEAVNSQQTLNVPSLFEASRNDAVNKALNKFASSANKNMEAIVQGDARPTVDLDRFIDGETEKLIADLENTLSYMPEEVLQKLRTDALDKVKPKKEGTLAVNFTKLQGHALTSLKNTVVGIPSNIDINFDAGGLNVTKVALDKAYNAYKTATINDYEVECNNLDPKCAPPSFHDDLSKAFDSQKEVLDAKYVAYWNSWVEEISTKELSALRTSLDKLAEVTAVGDDKAWSSGQLTASDLAKTNFKDALRNKYLGLDKSACQNTFEAEADSTAKTRQALWAKNDASVLEQLKRKLRKCEEDYSQRLNSSIPPQQQPPPYAEIIVTNKERIALENFIDNNHASAMVKDDLLSDFDSFVNKTQSTFQLNWQNALNNFEIYVQNQIDARLIGWKMAYEIRMDAISIAPKSASAAVVEQHCDAAQNVLTSSLKQFTTMLGNLRSDTVSALKLNNLGDTILSMSAEGKKQKLTQFDELASLYNRALLNKTLKPVIDKTMSDRDTYTNVRALDDALEAARISFMGDNGRGAATQPMALDESQSPSRQWEDFKKRNYAGLVDNVNRNGEAYILNGKDMLPKELQTKIIEKIKGCCANLGGMLGMSYCAEQCFTNPAADMGRVGNGDDVDSQKTQKWLCTNNSTSQEFWHDRKTNLFFNDWALEQSDYILGKPVITEIKPSIMVNAQYPAQKDTRTAIVGQNLTVSSTVTNSNSFERGFGGKLAVDKEFGPEGAKVTVGLEANFALKWTSGSSTAQGNQFTVSGSSTVELPGGRVNTVTQVGFDQQCTVPYTAKFKFVPKLSYQHGFVRGGGQYLKKDWFEANKDTDRVHKDFDMGRVDQIYQNMNANADPWDWSRFQRDGNAVYANWLGDENHYTFFVRGKWEGLTGKLVITTVTPSATQYSLLPDDDGL